MCKVISSDSVIGNLILESVERNQFTISIEKMFNYDELLSQKLESEDYCAGFDYFEILDFIDDYPFFVSPIDSNCLLIKNIENKSVLINQLTRYFRIGMPTYVIDVMKSVFSSVLEQEKK